jgi:hypothetical protein
MWVEAICHNRESQGSRHGEFIEGLGEGWKSEVGVLTRKLDGLLWQLEGLGPVDGESSLSETVEGVRSLTKGAVEELSVVEGLEREVVRREGRWVNEQVAGMSFDIEALLA